jgi:2-oxoglutarate ferredoxin oxidoreductase subunit beta
MKMEKQERVNGKPELWRSAPTTLPFCVGCQHGLGIRVILEAIEDLGIEGKTVFLGGGGCVYPIPDMVDLDAMQCPQGRASSIGSSMKQYLGNDTIIITYQDDNDTLSIGTESIIQSASRGDPITIIMANNGSYGSSGWQMVSQGDEIKLPEIGKPNRSFSIDIIDLMQELTGVAYLARGAVNSPEAFDHTKGYVKTAIQKQVAHDGFSLVDILMACPTRWGLTPELSIKWIEDEMMVRFPLGEFKNVKVSDKENKNG